MYDFFYRTTLAESDAKKKAIVAYLKANGPKTIKDISGHLRLPETKVRCRVKCLQGKVVKLNQGSNTYELVAVSYLFIFIFRFYWIFFSHLVLGDQGQSPGLPSRQQGLPQQPRGQWRGLPPGLLSRQRGLPSQQLGPPKPAARSLLLGGDQGLLASLRYVFFYLIVFRWNFVCVSLSMCLWVICWNFDYYFTADGPNSAAGGPNSAAGSPNSAADGWSSAASRKYAKS